MRIGIVTAWSEKGAGYVSRAYMDALTKAGHEVLIYARDGYCAIGDSRWDAEYVTWAHNSYFPLRHFCNWIEKHKLDVLFYNEERTFLRLYYVALKYPHIKQGAYVDYYTEGMLPFFEIYDFLICNTRRHMEAMDDNEQCYYVPWGTYLDIFLPKEREVRERNIVFFHSAGMSVRKGTDILVNTFLKHGLYESSELIIHAQLPIEQLVPKKTQEELQKYRIKIIEKTVPAPGMYYLGDVYVYPTRLEGIGLTMYEALSCGMPVITTDYPPMNEVIDDRVGKLVKVRRHYCREDGYYWPMSLCDEEDLAEKMRYYILNKEKVYEEGKQARDLIEKQYNWKDRTEQLNDIFCNVKKREIKENVLTLIEKRYHKTSEYRTKVRNGGGLYRGIVNWGSENA